MAIDQTNIALDIAVRTVNAAGRFLDVLNSLEEELEHGMCAGLNFTDYDSDFIESEELKHLDGAVLNKLLAQATPNIRTYIESTMAGTQTYEQLLYRVRR